MPDDPISRLVLGTVQLGMNYGIANRTGRPSRVQADEILLLAHREGIRLLDTAQAYGNSEAVIGNFLRHHPQCDFAIISKLDPSIDVANGDAIMAAVQRSRQQIGQNLEAILIHDAAALESWHGDLGRALCQCVDEGWVGTLGVSIYAPEELEAALNIEEIGLVQAPFNVFDRRIADSGLLERALLMGKRMFLRSIYLQGLLLVDACDLTSRMYFAGEALQSWRKICARHSLGPHLAAIKYVAAAAPSASLVVGCETVSQLASTVEALRAAALDTACIDDIADLPRGGERLINPHLWS